MWLGTTRELSAAAPRPRVDVRFLCAAGAARACAHRYQHAPAFPHTRIWKRPHTHRARIKPAAARVRSANGSCRCLLLWCCGGRRGSACGLLTPSRHFQRLGRRGRRRSRRQADQVPVGEDQKQHLELTRDIATRFNNLYGDVFKVPEAYIPELGARVMSLQDPLKKMSKSDENPNAYIMLLDEPKKIEKKLKKAVTDSDEQARIYFDRDEKPGVSNLLTLLSVATKRSVEDLVPEYADKMYGHLKKDTAEAVVNMIEPIQARFKEIREDQTLLDNIMRNGAEKAGARAEKTLKAVYDAVGFIPRP